MKRKWLVGCLGVVVFGMLILLVTWRLAASHDQAALDHELSLARAEGLPTTWQEFADLVPRSTPQENAAPLYRKLKNQPKDKTDISSLDSDLLLRTNSQKIAEAKAALALHGDALATIDQAATLPHCWFDRDWSKGMAVLMPEYAWMKPGAKLVLLRGSLAVAEGDPETAVRNVKESFVVSTHSGEEGSVISTLVAEAIYAMGIHHLALWAYLHPGEPIYRKALEDSLAKWPKPNLQAMHKDDLLGLRDVLRLSTTSKGLADLGLKETDIPPIERLMPVIVSRPKADIKIARLMRQMWETYGLPPESRIAKMDALWEDLMPALAAYPTGSDIYFKLTDQGESDHTGYLYDQVWESRRLTFVALSRCLTGQTVPKTLDTHDLRSPFDGKPISYKSDGKQISIDVSCPDGKVNFKPFKFPTDKELSLTKKVAQPTISVRP